MIFLLLFSGSGAVNAPLESVGVQGPNWFTYSRGMLHQLLDPARTVGMAEPPLPRGVRVRT